MAGGKRKKTRNLILLVLLLVIAVGAYAAITLWPEEEAENTEIATEERTVLVEIEDDAVTKLEFKGQSTGMVLVQEEGIWYREDDRECPMNQTYTRNMASVIGGLTASKTVNENPESLGDYGLDDPKVWVRVYDAEGNSAEVSVGMKSPRGDGCYVAVEGKPAVYLATTSLLTQFQYSETQLIAKHTTPTLDPMSITHILIEKADGNVDLSWESGNEFDSTGYNPWLIKQGFDQIMPGNSDTINVLVENYADFPLGDCVEYSCEDPAKYGLADPTAHLSLVYYVQVEIGETNAETGEPETKLEFYSFGLKVGDSDGNGRYYVQLDETDAVYLMAQTDVDPMIQVDPYNYVSRLPGLVNIAQVDTVTIEYGDAKHEMKLTREMVTETDEDGNETEEEVTHYFLDGREVKKKELTGPYQEMIGVAIDGLVDQEIADQNSQEPILTLTYDRTGAGMDPIVTRFYPYNDNFNRISVNDLSIFRVNIRDVESLITMFEELFAE